MRSTKSPSQLVELLVILSLGIFLYAIHFYDYFPSFDSSIYCFDDPDDAKVYSWNTWHFSHQVSQLKNPFHTDYLFSPEGSGLWMHAYTVWFGVLNLLFDNVYLAINVGIMIQLLVAFVGFYYLAKRLIGNKYLAAAVACFAVFNFYILSKVVVHYNLVLIGILPFLLIQIMELFDLETLQFRGNSKLIIGLLLLLILGIFMEYYVVFYALAFLLIYVLWVGFFARWFGSWSWKKSGVLALVLGLGHVVARLLRITGVDEKGAIWGAPDIQLLWWKSATAHEGIHAINTLNDNKVYIGLSVLVLFALALYVYFSSYRKNKTAQFLLFGTTLFFMVTFPVFRWGEHDIFYHLTSIIHYIPGIQNIRAPDRFVLMFILFLVLFITYIVYSYLKDNKRPNYMPLMAWFMVSLVVSSFRTGKMQPVNTVSHSKLLAKLENKPILILPFGIRDGYREYGDFDEDQLLLQQKYHFHIPNGYLSRVSDEHWAQAASTPLFSALVALQADTLVEEVEWRKLIKQSVYKQVFVPHKYKQENPQISRMIEQLPVPNQEDEYGVLYTLD